MNEPCIEPRLWLEAEFLSRKQKNPNYSLRAFSRLLDLPSGRVSQLLSRKRNFTPKLGKQIALRLNCDPERTHSLLAGIQQSRGKPKTEEKYSALDMDKFQSIAHPLHFAILSLMETAGFKSDAKFIAAKLGVTPLDARLALERLLRIGLVTQQENGKLALAQQPGLATSHDIQSAALREAHKKVLAESIAALDEVAVELRDITSITMAIDPKKLPAAKQRLKAMRRELSGFLESGKKTEVYRLNIQLVPVTKRGKEQ